MQVDSQNVGLDGCGKVIVGSYIYVPISPSWNEISLSLVLSWPFKGPE